MEINNINITANSSVVVSGEKILIDGKVVVGEPNKLHNSPIINITVNGNVQTVDVDKCDSLTINGNVSGNVSLEKGNLNIKSTSGNINL